MEWSCTESSCSLGFFPAFPSFFLCLMMHVCLFLTAIQFGRGAYLFVAGIHQVSQRARCLDGYQAILPIRSLLASGAC